MSGGEFEKRIKGLFSHLFHSLFEDEMMRIVAEAEKEFPKNVLIEHVLFREDTDELEAWFKKWFGGTKTS